MTLCLSLKSSTELDDSSSAIRRAACWIGAAALEPKRGEVVNADTEAVMVTREIAKEEIFMIPNQFNAMQFNSIQSMWNYRCTYSTVQLETWGRGCALFARFHLTLEGRSALIFFQSTSRRIHRIG